MQTDNTLSGRAQRWLLILAACLAAAFATACGGGDDAATMDALRAQGKAAAQQAASPAQAATQVMDYAEAHYGSYFPSHQADQQATYEGTLFRFRYYPQTGIYLGVVLEAGPGYAAGGVYALGGPFSSLFYAGPLTNYVTVSSVQPNGTTSAATLNPALAGTRALKFFGNTAGCGASCTFTEGQSLAVTVHADGRLSLPGLELSNPFQRHFGASPNTAEIIWLDATRNTEYALSHNGTGVFNEINVGNANSPQSYGVPAFIGQIRNP
jgi:hypothetical protein